MCLYFEEPTARRCGQGVDFSNSRVASGSTGTRWARILTDAEGVSGAEALAPACAVVSDNLRTRNVGKDGHSTQRQCGSQCTPAYSDRLLTTIVPFARYSSQFMAEAVSIFLSLCALSPSLSLFWISHCPSSLSFSLTILPF